MSRLISQVLIICFQPRYGFGVSPACPDKRPLTISSLGFGFVLFLLDPSKEEHIFVCCLLAPVSFSCFSPFVSMWRHCKTGAADSPAARRGCPAPPRGTSSGLRRCPRARKGRGQSRPPRCARVGTGQGAEEQHSWRCSTLLTFFFFKSGDFKGCFCF